jgi:putative effector of murein hydrolase
MRISVKEKKILIVTLLFFMSITFNLYSFKDYMNGGNWIAFIINSIISINVILFIIALFIEGPLV